MQDSGSAILHAAAQARAILLATAGERLGVAPSELKTENGTVIAPNGLAIDQKVPAAVPTNMTERDRWEYLALK